MKVIEHGNTYNTAFCPHCDAELGYTKKDIYIQDYLDLHPFGGGRRKNPQRVFNLSRMRTKI